MAKRDPEITGEMTWTPPAPRAKGARTRTVVYHDASERVFALSPAEVRTIVQVLRFQLLSAGYDATTARLIERFMAG